jgi:hypothetical protein
LLTVIGRMEMWRLAKVSRVPDEPVRLKCELELT